MFRPPGQAVSRVERLCCRSPVLSAFKLGVKPPRAPFSNLLLEPVYFLPSPRLAGGVHQLEDARAGGVGDDQALRLAERGDPERLLFR